MFFDMEAKAEAGMPPLVPAFPISVLMLYALCPHPQRENNYFIWSWYITIWIKTCYIFSYSER